MAANLETAPAPAQRSLGQLLVGLIDQPGQTFEAIQARKSFWMWAVPLLIIMLAFAVLIVVQTPYTFELAQQQAERQLATLPPEQADAARQSMAFTMSWPFMLAMSLTSGLVVIILAILLQAAFFYFSALITGGNDTQFGAVFTMSAWARLPLAIGALVQAGFIAVTQRFMQYTGLAFLVSTGDPLEDAANPMIALLSGVDLFWLWNLFLLVIGLSVVARLNRGKSLVLVLIYAAIALGMTVLPSLFFSGFTG